MSHCTHDFLVLRPETKNRTNCIGSF